MKLFCCFQNISKTVIWTSLFPGKALKEITIALDSRYSSGLLSKVCKKSTYTTTGNEYVCPHAVLTAVELHIKKKKKPKTSKYFLP